MQQALQVEVGTFADQFQLELKGLADRLAAAEFEHLQIVAEAFDTEAEMGLVGRGEHSLFLFFRSMNEPAILRAHRPDNRAYPTFIACRLERHGAPYEARADRCQD